MTKEAKPKTRFTVEVTQNDIERAVKENSSKCVVAQAIARTFKDATRIEVDTQTVRFTLPESGRLAFLTPYGVQGYIIGFDAGDDIEPFTFQLRDPIKVQQFKWTEDGKKKLRRKRALAKGAAPSEDDQRILAATPETPHIERTEGEQRRSPPRVFKLKRRTYGARLLRINKEQAAMAAQAT